MASRVRTVELIDLPLHDAADRRWRAGREKYGGGEWVGQPPLLEAAEEWADFYAYIYEAIRRGDIERDSADRLLFYMHKAWRELQNVLKEGS